MVVYAALGIILVLFLMVAARWYVNANPATLVQVLKWGAVGLVGITGGYLALTGRLGWALFAAPMLVPLWRRVRYWFRGGGPFAGGDSSEGIGSPGQTSEVRSAFVRMVLDHDSGAMDGEVLQGRFAGRRLGDLALGELLIVLGEARHDDESVQLLSAYLDRVHGDDWRAQAAGQDGQTRSAAQKNGVMSREEAFEILGLEPDADAAAIKAAYHRLMSKIHPDLGGSTYLAAKINQAKDTLLGS